MAFLFIISIVLRGLISWRLNEHLGSIFNITVFYRHFYLLIPNLIFSFAGYQWLRKKLDNKIAVFIYSVIVGASLFWDYQPILTFVLIINIFTLALITKALPFISVQKEKKHFNISIANRLKTALQETVFLSMDHILSFYSFYPLAWQKRPAFFW